MEEELARNLARKADNNAQPKKMGGIPSLATTPIHMTKIFGGNDAKRMSFDENMPNYQQYSGSPLSSFLSQSPGGGAGFNSGRRDSLKNMWHLQDFGTD